MKFTHIPVKFTLFRIGRISGMFYQNTLAPSRRLVIYGIGAPIPPDNGSLPDAADILKFETDLFVPDYIGFGRSEGIFTPKNCIRTFLELFHDLTQGCTARNSFLGISRHLRYDEILFIGRSFGGMYVLLLPKFNPKIRSICAIYPILDYSACGLISGEETVSGFMKAMNDDGYRHIYRGISKPEWIEHFQNRDGLRPIENLNNLENTRVFIGHGKRDHNINFSHSVKFQAELAKRFPARIKQFKISLYNADHSHDTSGLAVGDFLTWMNIPLVKQTGYNLV